MMAPCRRVCTPARMLKMVWLKMYEPVSPAPCQSSDCVAQPCITNATRLLVSMSESSS